MMRTRRSISATAGGVILVIFGVVSLAFTVLVAWAAYWGYQQQQRAAEEFVPVQAEVLHSEVERRESSSGTGSNRSTTVSYSPKIRYRYTVGGRTYESSQYAYTYQSDEQTVRSAVAARPAGSTTTVYYDPESPAEAVLYRGVDSPMLVVVLSIVFITTSLGMIVGGGFLIAVGRRKKAAIESVREARRHRDVGPCPHCGMTYLYDGQYCGHCKRPA